MLDAIQGSLPLVAYWTKLHLTCELSAAPIRWVGNDGLPKKVTQPKINAKINATGKMTHVSQMLLSLFLSI